MSDRFTGCVAIVTGAGRGVGACAADLLVEEGASVVAIDRLTDGLEALTERHGPAIWAVKSDVRAAGESEQVVRMALEQFGRLDLVFANAGVTDRASLEKTDDVLWDDMITTNLTSVFRLFRAAAPAVIHGGGGSFVVNASINALRGNLGLAAYAAAKTGVVGLTRALAVELAPRGIRVNAICPGTIASPMTDEYLASLDDADADAERRAMVAKHPLGRFASPEEVARVALFLLSRDASFVTGVALPVDGGRHIA